MDDHHRPLVRLAIDVGGTFTDLVLLDPASGQLVIGKSLTTPQAPAEGVLRTVTQAGVALDRAALFIHGTTIVVNAITERKGARTALITTAGFRDVLEIGRSNRPEMYNFRYHRPTPFVPRHLRFEVQERIDSRGAVVTPLRIDDLGPIVEACRREGVAVIAICLLHAYANPAHERAIASYLREHAPDLAATASHQISRQWREFERASTAVLNAYVQPVATGYLGALERRLRASSFGGTIAMMHSSGGTTTLDVARERPIILLESGPVAGVAAAARLGTLVGQPQIVSLDIGGTTAKCSLVVDGEMSIVTDYRVGRSHTSEGYPIQIPVVDIVEIGAGGGSIVCLEASGALRVGPKSAGALPGPACYGNGGDEPTVTDAALLAGWLNPESFAGGRIALRPDLAEAAYARLGATLGLSAQEAALGALRLANATMIEALKLVSIQRGHDPQEFALVVSGGGGPLHGALLARELRFRSLIVPRHPGVFSAWGMLLMEQRLDLLRTRVADVAEEGVLGSLAAEMRAEAAETLGRSDLRCVLAADLRYRGQEHAVRVALPEELCAAAISAAFHTAHERAYRFSLPDTPVELVTLHLSAYLPGGDQSSLAWRPQASVAPAPVARREVYFGELGWHAAPVYERVALPPDFRAQGPLVVEEPTSATLVPPDAVLRVDAYGNLELSFE